MAGHAPSMHFHSPGLWDPAECMFAYCDQFDHIHYRSCLLHGLVSCSFSKGKTLGLRVGV